MGLFVIGQVLWAYLIFIVFGLVVGAAVSYVLPPRRSAALEPPASSSAKYM